MQDRGSVSQFQIFSGDAMIGRIFPDRIDRSGCTLIGSFVPTAEYAPESHAANINGESRPLTSRSSLQVHGPDDEIVAALDVCIYECRNSFGNPTRDAYIIGIPPEIFDLYAPDEN